MNWIMKLFAKKSEIKSVAFYGDVVITCNNKNVEKIIAAGVSFFSILKTRQADLSIVVHHTSFLNKECCEIIYFENDITSKNIVQAFCKKYKKFFKDEQIAKLEMNSYNVYYNWFYPLKTLKAKIIIKPSNNQDLSQLLSEFLEEI